MRDTYAIVRSPAEHAELMSAYERKGWRWASGQRPSEFAPPQSFPYRVLVRDGFHYKAAEPHDPWDGSNHVRVSDAVRLLRGESATVLTKKSLESLYDGIMSDCDPQGGWFLAHPSLYQGIVKVTDPNPKPFMSKAAKFLRDLTLSEDDRLLRRMGLEDENGEPTHEGYDLSDEISYAANRAKVIEVARKMEEEQKKSK